MIETADSNVDLCLNALAAATAAWNEGMVVSLDQKIGCALVGEAKQRKLSRRDADVWC